MADNILPVQFRFPPVPILDPRDDHGNIQKLWWYLTQLPGTLGRVIDNDETAAGIGVGHNPEIAIWRNNTTLTDRQGHSQLSGAAGTKMLEALDKSYTYINAQPDSTGVEYADVECNVAAVGTGANVDLNAGDATGITSLTVKSPIESGGVGTVYITPWGSRDSSDGKVTELRFLEADITSGHHVGFKAPDPIASSVMWTLPNTDSTGTQSLQSDGSGNLSWGSGGGGSAPTAVSDTGGPFTLPDSTGSTTVASITLISTGFTTLTGSSTISLSQSLEDVIVYIAKNGTPITPNSDVMFEPIGGGGVATLSVNAIDPSGTTGDIYDLIVISNLGIGSGDLAYNCLITALTYA